MNITLTKYRIRATQSDHQRQKAKEAAADIMAWLWVAFIVALVLGSALLNVGAK